MELKELIEKWDEQIAMHRRVVEDPLMWTREDRQKSSHQTQAICALMADVKKLAIHNVSSRFYQVDFGNHLRCKLKVTDGKIEVEGAINGWGDGVPLEEVVILELNDC